MGIPGLGKIVDRNESANYLMKIGFLQ